MEHLEGLKMMKTIVILKNSLASIVIELPVEEVRSAFLDALYCRDETFGDDRYTIVTGQVAGVFPAEWALNYQQDVINGGLNV